MLPGALNPGKPVSNLYVSITSHLASSVIILLAYHIPQFFMWSHDVVSTTVSLAGMLKGLWRMHMLFDKALSTAAGDLKMGQYLKIPPTAMFIAQMWGTLLGASRHCPSEACGGTQGCK